MSFTSGAKKIGYRLAAISVFGLAAFFPANDAGAHRLHDPQVAPKVIAEKTAAPDGSMESEAKRHAAFQERINAILHPKAAKDEAGQKADLPADVPQTLSASDNSILGTALATESQCVKYLLSVNPHPRIAVSPEKLVAYYYEEGRREGVRPDVAFAQALKETGFFNYGGTVTPDQNNYCGLGTTSAVVKGAYFSSPSVGVRAHIQHLLAYASTRRPQGAIVDPRYALVRSSYGESTLGKWEDLNGRWAVPGYSYGQSIMAMFRDILKS